MFSWAKWRQRKEGILRVSCHIRRCPAPVASRIRCPAPDIASNAAPRSRIWHWPSLERIVFRQCGRSSQARVGARPCEVVSALACMRSAQGYERTARAAPILRKTRADAVTSGGWRARGKRARAKRAVAANLVTKAPAAALGRDARTARMLRRTAGTPQDTFPAAIKMAPALVRCPIVPQRSVAHLHAAAGEVGASCSHDLGVRT